MIQNRPVLEEKKNAGCTLILSVLLAGLQMALILSFHTFLSVEVKRAETVRRDLQVREAARLSLYMAIGEVQRLTGPDQRITSSAEILGNQVIAGAKGWTGVWNTIDPLAAPQWLVSGNQPNPRTSVRPLIKMLDGYDHHGDGDWTGRADVLPIEVPLVVLPGECELQFAWFVLDEGTKAALRPMAGMLEEKSDSKGSGYLDYNANTLHAARFRQAPGFAFPLLYGPSERSFALKIQSAESIDQLGILAERLSEEEKARVLSEFHNSVCLQNRFVFSNPLDGGLKKDLSFCKTLPLDELSDDTLRTIYEDPDDLLRADTARIIQHRSNPSATTQTRSNQRMLLSADTAEEAAKQFQNFSLAPIVTELELVLALTASPLSGLKKMQSGPNYELRLAHQLTIELWNPYTVPFLLGEKLAGKQPGYSDMRFVIRHLPNYQLAKSTDGAVLTSGNLPEINLVWSRDSGIQRYRKRLRPGMVYRKSLPAATARNVRTYPVDQLSINEQDALTGTFLFTNNRPLEIELYGIDSSGTEKSFFKAAIQGYHDFIREYTAARNNEPGRLLYKGKLRPSLLKNNRNAFAFRLCLLDRQNTEDGSEHFSRLLSHYDPRKTLLEVDLQTHDPKNPWSCEPPLPYEFTVDGRNDQPSHYKADTAFSSGDVFHHNESSSIGGRKDRVARAFDFPIGEVIDLGIFRTLSYRDYPANAIGNPHGGLLNRLYDRYFFSTLPADEETEWNDARPLANARIRSFKNISHLENIDTSEKLLLANGFNLNSAVPRAWEKVLSGRFFPIGTLQIKFEEPNGKPDWQKLTVPVRHAVANFPQTTLFNQSESASGDGYHLALRNLTENYSDRFNIDQFSLSSDRQHPALRQSIRELTMVEVKDLADAVIQALQKFVQENERPPFSLSEYLNAGILQQAIDATPSLNLRTNGYDHIPRHGAASITQATLMNTLGPLAFVRSDTFTIRAYARAKDPHYKGIASALCQARVQRIPELASDGFGRRYIVQNFQWLEPNSIGQ